jgi:hypothetical protein
MTPQEKFIAFLEDHPGYFSVSKSDLYIHILSTIEQQAIDMNSLSCELRGIEIDDLELMLNSLVALKLIGVIKTGSRTIYYITDNAKEFLELYRSTKQGFGNM